MSVCRRRRLASTALRIMWPREALVVGPSPILPRTLVARTIWSRRTAPLASQLPMWVSATPPGVALGPAG